MSAPTRLGPRNFAHLLLTAADRHPDRRAIATMDAAVTYRQLADLAINFARHLRMHRVNHRARIAIHGEHPIIMTALTIACALLGCSWLRATQPAQQHPALRITHLAHLGPPPPWPGARFLQVGPDWSRPPPGMHATEAPFTGFQTSNDAWMIANSSGTTGMPKFMALSEAMIWDRIKDGQYAGSREGRVAMSLFPVLSYPNILATLRSLTAGGGCIFGELAELFGRVHIDSVMGSPAHVTAFMDSTAPGPARIPEVIVGGAGAGPAFFRRLLDYAETILFLYGSTEAAMTTTTVLTREAVDALDPGGRPSVGAIAPNCDVQITDADGMPLAAGAMGEIRIRAPGMVTSYIGEPGLSAHVFRNGWFHPGDIGSLDPAGRLHVGGRLNETLNIGGAKLSPEPVDDLIQALPGIRDGACFALTDSNGLDRLAAAVVPDSARDPILLAMDLAKQAAARLRAYERPSVLFVLAALPRNPNGKVIRHELASAARGAKAYPVEDVST